MSAAPALSETRHRILSLVAERPRTVCELERAVGVRKSAVHRHLQRLVADGFLERADSSRKWVYYRLAGERHE